MGYGARCNGIGASIGKYVGAGFVGGQILLFGASAGSLLPTWMDESQCLILANRARQGSGSAKRLGGVSFRGQAYCGDKKEFGNMAVG
jgi:hypothetical protein